MKTCSIAGCQNIQHASGLCSTHRCRERLYGSPLVTKNRPPGAGFVALGYKATQVDGVKKFDHVRIAKPVLGKPLPPGAVVHHADGRKDNNSNSNLVICPDRAYYNLLHARIDAMAATGDPNKMKCRHYKTYDDVKTSWYMKWVEKPPIGTLNAAGKLPSKNTKKGSAMLLFLDIETLPSDDPAVAEALAAKITAPANYKKPESIAEWERENKPALVKEAIAKTSFDGMFGSIACIAYAFDDGEIFAEADDDEARLLENFYSHVFDRATINTYAGTIDRTLTVVGHNIAGFDLPFLKARSIINRVKPVAQIMKTMNAKPWDGCIADTMLLWSADRERRASMDKLCKAFGIKGKGDFDGSMVAATWTVDRQKVIDYCCDDVERTRQIYKRLMFAD